MWYANGIEIKKDYNHTYGDGGVSLGLSLSVLEAMETESSTTRTKTHLFSET